MSGPFYVKAGDDQPVYSAVLTNGSGELLDLTGATVVLRLKALASPYGYTEHAATPDPDQVANKGLVTYAWNGTPKGNESPGEFWSEWYVNGIVTLPTVGQNRVSVQPILTDDGLPHFGPVVTLDDVEAMAMRTLTNAEAQRALLLIDELTTLVERYTHRDVRVKRRTETGVLGPTGRWFPHWTPVIAVEALTVDGADRLADYTADPTLSWFPGTPYSATYVSGLAEPQMHPAFGVILKGVTAVTLAPAEVGAGVLQSYNVEGTSISYGPAVSAGQGNVGRIPVADVAALGLNRRALIG